MKKTILKHMTISGYMKGIDLTECEILAKKLEDGRDKMKEAKNIVKAAKKELNQAMENSIKKIKKEKESEQKIGINGERIIDFKSEFIKEKKALKAKYQKMVRRLERKESDIKIKLNEYKEKGQNKWNIFKRELNNDLDGIEKTLKDFMVDNKKKVKKLAS